MKRKIILSLIVLFVSLVILIIVHAYLNKRQDLAKYKLLPVFSFSTIYNQDFSTAVLPRYKGYVIHVFNPGCDICKDEAADYLKHKVLLQDVLFLMVSPDSTGRIKEFALKSRLSAEDNFIFGHIDEKSFIQHLGHVSIPTLFIYNSQKRIVGKVAIIQAIDIPDRLNNKPIK